MKLLLFVVDMLFISVGLSLAALAKENS